MTASIAYISTFLSAACFGLASVWEQVGTKRVGPLDSIRSAGFLALLKQLPYLAGLLLDGVGFILFLIAVHSLPLFFVEAVGTASIAVTALAARYIIKVRLTGKEYRLMAMMILGLVILSYTATPETAAAVSNAFRYALLYGAITLGVVFLLVKRLNRRPILTAALSGLSFSGLAVASRVLPVTFNLWALATNPLVLALIIYGLLGILLFSMALQTGSVNHVYAVNFVVETIVPTVAGILLLGDSVRHGLWFVMAAGLIITVASTSALALSKDYRSRA